MWTRFSISGYACRCRATAKRKRGSFWNHCSKRKAAPYALARTPSRPARILTAAPYRAPHASVPVLHQRPDFVQGPLEAAAIIDVEMLVRHGVGVINAGDFLNVGKPRLEVILPPSHDDHTFAGVPTRPPEEVVLMRADGGRQAVFRTEQVDGSGLAVILAEDRGFRSDLRREVVIDARDGRRHLLPAKLVGKELRQRAEPVSFDRGRREMQRPGIPDVRLGRQNRNRNRREERGGRDQQNW